MQAKPVTEEATGMERVPILELCAFPNKITERLNRAGQLVLTNDNGPMAIILKVDNSTLKETFFELQSMQMQRAIKTIQEASARSGKSKMTLKEINAEIGAARAEKKTR